ncbi:MAG: hypothetical protein SFY69_06810 [Planctomycetota bacterium]|nr:hypothetical protein [Planctomycetota bacterium]
MAQQAGIRTARVATGDRLNTIGVNQMDLEVLLAHMDGGENGSGPRSKRAFARWPYRQVTVVTDFIHPGGSAVTLRLAARNLSRRGVSLLHNSFLYPGTKCFAHLPKLNGSTVKSAGVIKQCRHHRGVIHELGIQLERPLKLSEFVSNTDTGVLHALEAVDAGRLEGHMLHVEDSDLDARIVPHFLTGSKLKITRVKTAGEALEALPGTFDVVLCDWHLGDRVASDLLHELRSKGINVPIVVATADPLAVLSSDPARFRIGLLPKPFTQDQLLVTLGEWLIIAKEDAPAPPPQMGFSALL